MFLCKTYQARLMNRYKVIFDVLFYSFLRTVLRAFHVVHRISSIIPAKISKQGFVVLRISEVAPNDCL